MTYRRRIGPHRSEAGLHFVGNVWRSRFRTKDHWGMFLQLGSIVDIMFADTTPLHLLGLLQDEIRYFLALSALLIRAERRLRFICLLMFNTNSRTASTQTASVHAILREPSMHKTSGIILSQFLKYRQVSHGMTPVAPKLRVPKQRSR